MKHISFLTCLMLFETLLIAQPINTQEHAKTTSSINYSEVQSVQQKIERTLSILKPDVLKNKHVGEIILRFEKAGLRVVAIKMMQLNYDEASKFYAIHRTRPFFSDLVKLMSSAPIIVMVLEGENAIIKNRQLMGATNPKDAEKGTIRSDFAESVSQNSVHGSDSSETAQNEIAFFFKPNEIFNNY